eukprot:22977_6
MAMTQPSAGLRLVSCDPAPLFQGPFSCSSTAAIPFYFSIFGDALFRGCRHACLRVEAYDKQKRSQTVLRMRFGKVQHNMSGFS